VYRKVEAEPKVVQWFYGVDRFADKYATMSPYQYGANNPLKYIDVNGDSIRIGNQVRASGNQHEGDDKFTSTVFAALNSIYGNIEKDGDALKYMV
jgi:hypothetical protein